MNDWMFLAATIILLVACCACAYYTGYQKAHDEMFDKLSKRSQNHVEAR